MVKVVFVNGFEFDFKAETARETCANDCVNHLIVQIQTDNAELEKELNSLLEQRKRG